MWGGVDGGASSVRYATNSGAGGLQEVGGEKQVDLPFIASCTTSASLLLSFVPLQAEVLRLHLKAQGGVQSDDSPGGEVTQEDEFGYSPPSAR